MAQTDAPSTPDWYRGPVDPSGYRQALAENLRWMRGPAGAGLSQQDMAHALSAELHRHVPPSSVARWEKGIKEAGGTVLLAYITVSGAARPTDVEGRDLRLLPEQRLRQVEDRLRRMEQLPDASPAGLVDPISATEAMDLAGVRRQTIHNWVQSGKVRGQFSDRHKRRLMVERADVVARLDGLSGNRSR